MTQVRREFCSSGNSQDQCLVCRSKPGDCLRLAEYRGQARPRPVVTSPFDWNFLGVIGLAKTVKLSTAYG